MAKDDFLHDHQVQAMIKPIMDVLEALRPMGSEQRIRIIAGVACFFGCSTQVVERIERAGREGVQRGN